MKTFIVVLFFLLNGQIEFKIFETPDTVEVCQPNADEAAKKVMQEAPGKFNDVVAHCFAAAPNLST